MQYTNYLKINALIFEIDVAPENEKYDKIAQITNPDPEYALYNTNLFTIRSIKHITDKSITETDFDDLLKYLFYKKHTESTINNDTAINCMKILYDVSTIDDFINKEMDYNIHYFKSYERAFNFRFIFNKQYLLFENGYSGIYRNYDMFGNLVIEYYHTNGIKEGECFYNKRKYIFVNGVEINNKINSYDLDILEHFLYDYE
jgi:hypothetical protein